jgi:MFS family permease
LRHRRLYRWYVLAVLAMSYAVYNLDRNVISVLIEPIKAEFGFNDGQLGLLTGFATTLPFALVCVPFGLLADRFNRKRLLIALIIGWSAMTGTSGIASSASLLFASRFGIGAFEAGFTPVSLSILTDTFPRNLRSTAMGVFSFGAPVGIFLGMAIGSLVASAYGWRSAFFAAGLPGLLLGLLIAATFVEARRGRYDAPPGDCAGAAPLNKVFANLWRDPALFNLSVAMMCCAVFLSAVGVWTPSFLIRVYGLPIHHAGLAAAIVSGVCGASGAVAGGTIADRIGRHEEWRRLQVCTFGTCATIVCALGALLVADRLEMVLALLGLATFFGYFYLGIGYSIASALAPLAMRATTVSLLLVVFNVISYGLGTAVVGVLSDAMSSWVGVRAIGFGMASTTVFSLLGVVHFRRTQTILRERADPQPSNPLAPNHG